MNNTRQILRPGLRLAGTGILLFVLLFLLGSGRSPNERAGIVDTATPLPSSTPEPLIPSPTPTGAPETMPGTISAEPTTISTTKATETALFTTAPPTRRPSSPTSLWRGRPRWGAGVAAGSISSYHVEPLRLGWYLNWRTQIDPPRPDGIEYVQMVRFKEKRLQPAAETITEIARANPGSLWLISNEPDVKWQDNVEPATYARLYHDAYDAIKAADPTAQVAIGGVSQPTPLRLRYLDEMLAAYREQFGAEAPADAWHVHNFILREERGSWGVDIPPGLADDQGVLYEIDDNDDMEAFRQQIVDFRQWMAEHGYRDYPLIVSEYGIPMPEDYGFSPERVVAFLWSTFDFLSTATDEELGYAQDGYRLVQRWCWYSLSAPDTYYPQGRLFDPATGQMTVVGQGWEKYVGELSHLSE